MSTETTKFDGKIFNPMAFGQYVETVPNTKKNALAKSKVIGTSLQAKKSLADQTGSLYTRIPYFGRINGKTSQNNDGNTDIESTKLETYDQGIIAISRMDSWLERDFSTYITAGVPFMDVVASQIADYKMEVKQDILLAILNGIYSMNTDGDTVSAQANAEFLEKHTHDITAEDDGTVKSSTLNKAVQKAGGDNKNIFKLAIMHSEVATNLENLKLLKYMTHQDSNGIEQELTLGTWNGRTVLIDDNMPTIVGNPVDGEDEESTYYTTYVLGENSIILDTIDMKPEHAYEMERDAKKNGGQDSLIVRDRYIVGVNGISFEKPNSITASATNADLENGNNWAVVNNDATAIDHKAIAIARIISKG